MNLPDTTLLLVLCCVVTSVQEDEWIEIPPEPMNKIIFPDEKFQGTEDVFEEQCENVPENAWERTNLFESDIMLPGDASFRNVMRDQSRFWRRGVVPYYIDRKYFNYGQRKVIEKAMQEIRNRTCVQFRPYKKNDLNYITFTGKKGGCSSYVGRQWKGQEINLEPPKCLTHGSVLHELLHSLGLHHQHSAPNRDKYIKILWENIMRGKEKNFRKMDLSRVTNLNIPYDYESIMHYSPRACSRNWKPTILPLVSHVNIGQRRRLSDGDVKKILTMYRCGKQYKKPYSSFHLN